MSLRKVKKKSLVTFGIVTMIYLISSVLLIINLLKLDGVETGIRLTIMIVALIFFFVYLYIGISRLQQKKKSYYVFSIASIIVSVLFLVLSFFIHYTINKLDKLSKDYIEYSTSLVSLSDTKLNNKSVFGKISDEKDIEGYLLADKLVADNKLENTIKEYETYHDLIEDLYDKKIDGIFLSSNYPILFGSDENYSSIVDDVKVDYVYKEKMKNEIIVDNTKTLTEPFTLLIIGVDSTSKTLNASSSFNGDTLMLITFNPNTLTATMLSIPRDTYVPIACRNNNKAKINSSAYGGTNCVINTVENLSGVEIDYFVKINFQGVVGLINKLGGIDVDVPYSFCEQDSQRRFGEHTIFVEKGLQTLNGEQALALSRNRHYWGNYCDKKWTSEGVRNDFTRGQNQQLVVEAVGNKIKSINSVKTIYKILDVVVDNIDTNISQDQMISFYQVAKDMLLKIVNENSEFIQLEKLFLQTKNQYIGGLSMEIYQNKSLDIIKKTMNANLEITKPEMIKSFSFSINDPYKDTLIGKGLYDGTTYDIVPKFVGKHISVVQDWAKQKGYGLVIEETTKDGVAEDIITKQNVPDGAYTNDYKTITVWKNKILSPEE